MESKWEATLDRVLALTVLLSEDMNEHLERIGLTGSRAHVVWELGRWGPCKQQALAVALKVTPRTITSLIDGLVATGFVTREPHPGDRRATQVTLTERGLAAAEGLRQAHRRLAEQLFADIPAAHFHRFDEVLGQVLGRLQSIIGQAEPPATTSDTRTDR